MQNRTKDIVSGSFILVFAITVFLVARGIESRLPIGVDSGFFPEIASALLALTAIIIIANGIWGKRCVGTSERLSGGQIKAVVATFFLVGLYIGLINVLGFVAATALYLPVQFFAISAPETSTTIRFLIVGIIVTATISLLFTNGFGLILPSGSLDWGF